MADDRLERRDAAMLIGRLGRRDLTSALVVLLGDPYPDVRAEAARALAMGVASLGTDVDPLAVAGLRRALADPGARTPLTVADGVAAAEMPSDQARELIAPLLDHPSALVREATRVLHSRWSGAEHFTAPDAARSDGRSAATIVGSGFRDGQRRSGGRGTGHTLRR